MPTSDIAANVKPARAGTVMAPSTAETMGLTALAGPLAGQTFELNVTDFWIGSAANNHLCLSADPAVSGNHACVRTEGAFRRIYDNGSLNNTWVNGKPVGTSAVLLHTGDRITIGQSEFIFQP
jgi:pSer/pThr/pTyr-binding forkhead associated (FHA) protein